MKISADKKIMYDGEESGFHTFEIVPGHILFYFENFNGASFETLDRCAISDKLGLVEMPIKGIYKSTPEDLSLLVKEIDGKLHFISAGETQPGRYKIFYLGSVEF